jgi:hypothetical protein
LLTFVFALRSPLFLFFLDLPMSDQQPGGLLTWAMGLRFSMSMDPGRQRLEDDIQLNGFSWLDEHLAQILAGPSHEEYAIFVLAAPS